MLFCNVVLILILFAQFISVNDFFSSLVFNVNHAVYHWRDEKHFILIWFIFVNDFFSSLIFDVDHAVYHWRDEECNELWYELLISFILLVRQLMHVLCSLTNRCKSLLSLIFEFQRKWKLSDTSIVWNLWIIHVLIYASANDFLDCWDEY